MNLTLFFRLICMVIFQRNAKDYSNTFFFCPSVYAKDGFNVSLQIHYGNYCISENGYRQLGHTWEDVEFGFTSIHEPLMSPDAENPEDTTQTVGKISISLMQEVFAKHGGIDWETTLSIKNYNKFLDIK